MRDTVWSQTADAGTYLAEVVEKPGTDGYVGILTVTYRPSDDLFFEQEVGLSYGAIFGPDGGDVYEWQNIAMSAIEEYEGI
jgi:hypothetical protein